MKKLSKLNKTLLYFIAILTLLFLLSLISLLIINNIKSLIITKQLQSHNYPSLNYVSLGAPEEVYTIPKDQKGFRDLSVVISPDGKKFAYVVIGDDKMSQVAINGHLGPKYEHIFFIVFSPDSNHVAYGVKDHGKQFVVLDEKEGQKYNWVLSPYFFTPDSHYFVYKVRNSANGEAVVINNDQSQWWERVYAPFVSKDNKELIYYSRKDGSLWRTIINLK